MRVSLSIPALALALALVPARAAAPGGPLPLKSAADGHHYRLDAKAGKVLFLSGEYPFKTFLCDHDLKTGQGRRHSVAEFRLLDSFVYLSKTDQALVAALRQRDVLMESDDDPDEPRLLLVSMRDGKVAKEIRLAKDTTVAALAKPDWTDKVFILLNAGEKAFVKTFDSATGEVGEAALIGNYRAEHSAFLDGSPTLVLDAMAQKQPRLVSYDLLGRKIITDIPRESGLDALAKSGDDIYASYQPPGESAGVVALLNPRDGSSRELARFEGDVESLLAAPGRVFVIAQDVTRKEKPNDLGYQPRLLGLIVGRGPVETIPWTSRRGRLFGYDEKSGKLLFSVTQPSGAWMASADKESLLQAATELERRSGEFWGNNARTWGMVGLVAAIIGLGVFVKKIRPECKSCG